MMWWVLQWTLYLTSAKQQTVLFATCPAAICSVNLCLLVRCGLNNEQCRFIFLPPLLLQFLCLSPSSCRCFTALIPLLIKSWFRGRFTLLPPAFIFFLSETKAFLEPGWVEDLPGWYVAVVHVGSHHHPSPALVALSCRKKRTYLRKKKTIHRKTWRRNKLTAQWRREQQNKAASETMRWNNI